MSEWEWVTEAQDAKRLHVPGGWLYVTQVDLRRVENHRGDVDFEQVWSSPVFVADGER